MSLGSVAPARETERQSPPEEPLSLTTVWLLLASCAASYLAFLMAGAAQFLLPMLAASWWGRAMIEEVRITPLWLTAWGGAAGRGARLAFRDGPLLFGGLAALAALLGAWKSGGRSRALILYHVACWNLALLLAAAIGFLWFRFRPWEGLAQALVCALLLGLALRGLVSFAAPYAAVRFPRAVASLLAFYIPFVTILVIFWRVNLRLPFFGLSSLATFAGVLAVLGLLGLAAAVSARRPQQRETWPARTTRRYVVAALAVLACLAAYGRVENALRDGSLARLNTAHYEFLYPPEAYARERVEKLAAEREALWPAMMTRLVGDTAVASKLRLRVFLYPTYEAKYTRTQSTSPFTVDGDAIHAVLNDVLPTVDRVADAEALVSSAWGKASLPFLQDAAAGYVAGLEAAASAAQVTAEEGPYSLTQLSDAGVFLSPLVRRPLAAEFAAWVGPTRLRQLSSAEPGGLDWRLPLEEGWRRRLLELASRWTPPPARPFARQFFKGVAFSHEGGVRSGYASERAARALRQLTALGADSVALMPFAFMPSPEAAGLRRFAGESDEALDYMTLVAHRAGMRVLLKPQIWLRGGQFPADVRFRNESDFRAWWSSYRQWILHYARLAERNGTDLFAVGTELQGVTGREADWRRLIAEVRRVYRGPLTYAANWGQEAEGLRFWDALDYVGVDAYYPLAESQGDTSEKTLEANAAKLAARLEEFQRRWGKPILFTEAGFPSHADAALEPWNEFRSAPVDVALQARCYEALFRAFYRRPWFAGMFWWKWHSSGLGGGPESPGYSPQDKPAAAVIARWFREPR